MSIDDISVASVFPAGGAAKLNAGCLFKFAHVAAVNSRDDNDLCVDGGGVSPLTQ